MRTGLLIVGCILVAAGIWVALGNLHYNQTTTQAQLGSFKVEATTQKTVPAPLGYAGIAIGAIVLLVGVTKKR